MLLNAQNVGVRLVALDLMLVDYGVYAMLGLPGKTMGDLSIAAI